MNTDELKDVAEPSSASTGSVADRPLGDPEIAIELLKMKVQELEDRVVKLPRLLWGSAKKMGKGEWDYRHRVKTALDVAGIKWAEIE